MALIVAAADFGPAKIKRNALIQSDAAFVLRKVKEDGHAFGLWAGVAWL